MKLNKLLILSICCTTFFVSDLSNAESQAAIAALDLSACAFGDTPVIPDGDAASSEDMTAAGQGVRAFVATTQDGLACIDAAEAELGEAITPEQKSALASKYNAAVDEMNAVAANYNSQVRAYKERTEETAE